MTQHLFPVLFSHSPKDKELISYFRNIFGFRPGNIHLYKLAFRHRSAAIEMNASKISNERLEYLGDAILSAVVADHLFKIFPLKDEGFLTEMRSKMVSRAQLNKLGLKLGLDKLLESNADTASGNKSMLGDAFEAFVGALYLDKGYVFTQKIVLGRIIANHFDLANLESTEFNFKSKILEWAQKEKAQLEFAVVSEGGKGHKRQYVIEVRVEGRILSQGTDFSIKGAEQLAAEKACQSLGLA